MCSAATGLLTSTQIVLLANRESPRCLMRLGDSWRILDADWAPRARTRSMPKLPGGGKDMSPGDLYRIQAASAQIQNHVLDGHHRVSVARALGQTEIDTDATVCEFAGPLPWEQAAIARIPALARNAAPV